LLVYRTPWPGSIYDRLRA